MSFDEIFESYYNLYRLESTTPTSSDAEYTVAMRLANEAVRRWRDYDNTYWKELFQTLQAADDGTKTLVTSTVAYDAPSDFKEAGGAIRYLDSNNNVVSNIPIINPHEVQFQGDKNRYAYFKGNPADEWQLRINPAPTSAENGRGIDYTYYKEPTLYTTGADISEVPNPRFIIHHMLANRFRGSRNPYYASALRDAEDALKVMKSQNDSGTWANPWVVPDRSSSVFGK